MSNDGIASRHDNLIYWPPKGDFIHFFLLPRLMTLPGRSHRVTSCSLFSVSKQLRAGSEQLSPLPLQVYSFYRCSNSPSFLVMLQISNCTSFQDDEDHRPLRGPCSSNCPSSQEYGTYLFEILYVVFLTSKKRMLLKLLETGKAPSPEKMFRNKVSGCTS